MSKIIVVIGAQWGDEGKGKIVDLLAEHFDIVARYLERLLEARGYSNEAAGVVSAAGRTR